MTTSKLYRKVKIKRYNKEIFMPSNKIFSPSILVRCIILLCFITLITPGILLDLPGLLQSATAATTNPSLKDTDGDGYYDGPDAWVSVNVGQIVYRQYRRGEDTNGNGKYEPKGEDGILGTEDDEYDPNNPNSHPTGDSILRFGIDSDEDGLFDSEEDKNQDGIYQPAGPGEYNLFLDYNSDGYHDDETNPFDVDSDDDGISDYDEIHIYRLDPNNADSDRDGIADGTEMGLTEKLLGLDGKEDGAPDGQGGYYPNDGTYVNIAGLPGQPETPTYVYAHIDTEVTSIRNSWIPDAEPESKTNPRLPNSDWDDKWESDEDLNYNGRTDPGETDAAFGFGLGREGWMGRNHELILSHIPIDDGPDYYQGQFAFYVGSSFNKKFNLSTIPVGVATIEPNLLSKELINESGYILVKIKLDEDQLDNFKILIKEKPEPGANEQQQLKEKETPVRKPATAIGYSDWVKSNIFTLAQTYRMDCADWTRFLFWNYHWNLQIPGNKFDFVDRTKNNQKNPKILIEYGYGTVHYYSPLTPRFDTGNHFIINDVEADPHVILISDAGGTTQLYDYGVGDSKLNKAPLKSVAGAISGKYFDTNRQLDYMKLLPGDMFILDWNDNHQPSKPYDPDKPRINHVYVLGPNGYIDSNSPAVPDELIYTWGNYWTAVTKTKVKGSKPVVYVDNETVIYRTSSGDVTEPVEASSGNPPVYSGKHASALFRSQITYYPERTLRSGTYAIWEQYSIKKPSISNAIIPRSTNKYPIRTYSEFLRFEQRGKSVQEYLYKI